MTFGKLILFFTTAIAGTAAIAASAAPQQPATPPGPGLDLINERCAFCHTTAQVLTVRKTPANWAVVVQSMIDRGAELTPEEQKTVVGYLSTNLPAPEGAPAAAPATAATPSPAKR